MVGKLPRVSASGLSRSMVIGASYSMSLYCYSVLRLDPYRGCGHRCGYCFVNFIPGYRGRVVPVGGFLWAFDRVVSGLRRTPVVSMPFRLSALTDPFQPLEEKARVSLGVLRLASERDLKIIVSTKSGLVAREPWLSAVKSLADRGGVVVQFTLISLDEELSRCLEPGAPSPSERLRAIERLSDEGVPVVVRLQPLIPYVNDNLDGLERLLDEVSAAGARQIIAEYYRFLSWRDLGTISRCVDARMRSRLLDRSLWEKFPTGSHKRPRMGYRLAGYKRIRAMASRRGLLFSTCREGLWDLHTAPNCCGVHFMKGYRLKPTLREYKLGLVGDPMYVRREELSSIPFKGMRLELERHYELLEKSSGV